jgi:hypothetical protein
MDPDEARDAHLVWGPPSGEFDDLVRAAGMALMGLKWMAQFEPPKPKLPADSIAILLGYDKEPEFGGAPDRVKTYWG